MATSAASSALAHAAGPGPLVCAGPQRRSKVCPRRPQRRSNAEEQRRDCGQRAVNARTRRSSRASTMGVSRAGSHGMNSFPHQARMAPPIPRPPPGAGFQSATAERRARGSRRSSRAPLSPDVAPTRAPAAASRG